MDGTAVAPSSYPSHGATNGYTAVQSTPQATAAAALSQEDATPASKKRKTNGVPGSRGVANLTPDQLSKKRANDREAQRAIRERTRNNISGLEQRIRELESQQPFQELQRVVAERDSALNECEELRRRLATVAQVVGTAAAAAGTNNSGGQHAAGTQHLAPASLNGTLFTIDDLIDPTWLNSDGVSAELAALTAQQAPLPSHPSAQQQNPFPSHGGQMGYSGEQQQQHVHPDLRSPSYATTHGSPDSASSHPEHISALRRWSPSMSALNAPPAPQYPQPQHGNGMQYDQQAPPAAQMQQQQQPGERERLGLNYIMDRSSPNNQPAQTQLQQGPSSPPLFARLPSNTPPSCPLDSLLSDFIAARRQLLASGSSMPEVLGPEYPSFIVLKDPSNPAARQDCHAVSALLIDILSKFPDINALPERVAVLYIMFLVMRWFICPCESCYQRLPEWVRPVAEQLERPHAHWVDNLPWLVSSPEDDLGLDLFWEMPEADGFNETVGSKAETFADTFLRPFMRKQLATSAIVKFDEFFVPFTTTLSLNWPYPADQVLVPALADSEGQGGSRNQLKLNATFETHLRDINNWSLGPDFAKTFPGLVEDVRIEDRVFSAEH